MFEVILNSTSFLINSNLFDTVIIALSTGTLVFFVACLGDKLEAHQSEALNKSKIFDKTSLKKEKLGEMLANFDKKLEYLRSEESKSNPLGVSPFENWIQVLSEKRDEVLEKILALEEILESLEYDFLNPDPFGYFNWMIILFLVLVIIYFFLKTQKNALKNKI